jgi:hypothetical protein
MKKTSMKKVSGLRLAAVLLALMLSATTARAAFSEPATNGGLTSATLIADFACGSVEPNDKELAYASEQGLTPEELAKALSQWTGLDFIVAISEKDGALIVDWAADSTLIANLDNRRQKNDFHFFDAESLRWFMMDSLWRTLDEAFHKDVHYTMTGGKELIFDELYPINVFPRDVPYLGSPFYFAHDDGRGDMQD